MSLSYLLDDAMVHRLKALDRALASTSAIIASMDGATRAHIRRQARISTIGATTRIENAVLTDAEIDWMDTALSLEDRPESFRAMRGRIEAKLSRDRERSIEEVAGCREMLEIVYTQGEAMFPLTHAILGGLHQELLKYHPPAAHHAGRYKTVTNSVVERDLATGEQRTVLETSLPGPVTEAAMEGLIDWYNATLRDHPWPVAVACEMVFRFLACHPFQDGNGRMSRALFILAMIASGDPALGQVVPYLAIDRAIEQNRPLYYSVLAQVSGGRFRQDPGRYRIEIFLSFMVRMMESALEATSVMAGRARTERDLPPSARTILRCFRDMPEVRLSPADIRSATHLPARTVSRLLGTLTRDGMIQRLGRGPATRYQLVF